MGRTGRVPALVTATAALAGVLVGLVAVPTASAATATATEGVNIRSGPGTSYRIVGGLSRGDRIETVGSASNGWIRVRVESRTAYVAARYLSTRSNASLPAATTIHAKGVRVTTAVLNVRTGPGLSYPVVGTIPEGRKVTLTGTFSRGFAQTVLGGHQRWVSAQYLASSTTSVAAKTVARIATVALDIRTTPSARTTVVTTVKKGTSLDTTGATSGAYAQIVFRGTIRWVTARYLANAKSILPTVPAAPPTSSKGTIALAFAKSQLGKPYRFGAAGPNAYDCSGLALAAWHKAGVSLPRTTYSQFKVGYRVSKSELRPGDLVFFYGPNPSHMGLYAGNGKVIHSPRPGRSVEYITMSYMPWAGAVRPG